MPQAGANSKTVWVQDFQGLSDRASPGANPILTNDLLNVKVQHGQVRPRGGLEPYPCINYAEEETADDASADIIGLWTYPIANDILDDALVRMLPTKLECFTTNQCWTDITGSALTGTALTRPQATIIDDVQVYVNEGADKPQKFEGDAMIAASSIAAGTSPYAKAITAYTGFLFLGNISDDGTFTDTFDGYRMIRYSDDWDADWSSCAGNELVLVETPGPLVAMLTLGDDCLCYKTDGIVRVHWVGQSVRFTQKKLQFSGGILAPLSLASLTDQLHCFLGTDGVLYVVDLSGQVTPISYDPLFNRIPPTISLDKLKYARALVDDEESTYYLFFDRTGLDNQLSNTYVSYNFRSKEFAYGEMGKNLNAFTNHRPAVGSPQVLLAASPTLVYEFDEALTDDGVKIIRYWTTGWVGLGEEGYCFGARLVLEKPFRGQAHVIVSMATDLDEDFKYPDTIRLIGGGPDDRFVEIDYKPPVINANFFKLKVTFTNRVVEAKVQLRRVGLELAPLRGMKQKIERGDNSIEA